MIRKTLIACAIITFLIILIEFLRIVDHIYSQLSPDFNQAAVMTVDFPSISKSDVRKVSDAIHAPCYPTPMVWCLMAMHSIKSRCVDGDLENVWRKADYICTVEQYFYPDSVDGLPLRSDRYHFVYLFNKSDKSDGNLMFIEDFISLITVSFYDYVDYDEQLEDEGYATDATKVYVYTSDHPPIHELTSVLAVGVANNGGISFISTYTIPPVYTIGKRKDTDK